MNYLLSKISGFVKDVAEFWNDGLLEKLCCFLVVWFSIFVIGTFVLVGLMFFFIDSFSFYEDILWQFLSVLFLLLGLVLLVALVYWCTKKVYKDYQKWKGAC